MIERIPLEILNNNKFELIDELYAPNYVEHTPQPGVAPTREGSKQTLIAPEEGVPGPPTTRSRTSIDSGDTRSCHRLTPTAR